MFWTHHSTLGNHQIMKGAAVKKNRKAKEFRTKKKTKKIRKAKRLITLPAVWER